MPSITGVDPSIPNTTGWYKPLSPEREANVPTLPVNDALRYLGGTPDPRDGPNAFVNLAILTRPEGIPTHLAHGQGFINYLNAYDRVKREAQEIRQAMAQADSVSAQMKAIEAAKKSMAIGRYKRALDEHGDPLRALVENPEIALGSSAGTSQFIRSLPRKPQWVGKGEPPDYWETPSGGVVQVNKGITDRSKESRIRYLQTELRNLRESKINGLNDPALDQKIDAAQSELYNELGIPVAENQEQGDVPQVSRPSALTRAAGSVLGSLISRAIDQRKPLAPVEIVTGAPPSAAPTTTTAGLLEEFEAFRKQRSKK